MRRRRKKRSRGTEESREIHTSIYTMTVKLVLTATPSWKYVGGSQWNLGGEGGGSHRSRVKG